MPSFWTRMKRLCRDRLCLIEFWTDRDRGEEDNGREDKKRETLTPKGTFRVK